MGLQNKFKRAQLLPLTLFVEELGKCDPSDLIGAGATIHWSLYCIPCCFAATNVLHKASFVPILKMQTAFFRSIMQLNICKTLPKYYVFDHIFRLYILLKFFAGFPSLWSELCVWVNGFQLAG